MFLASFCCFSLLSSFFDLSISKFVFKRSIFIQQKFWKPVVRFQTPLFIFPFYHLFFNVVSIWTYVTPFIYEARFPADPVDCAEISKIVDLEHHSRTSGPFSWKKNIKKLLLHFLEFLESQFFISEGCKVGICRILRKDEIPKSRHDFLSLLMLSLGFRALIFRGESSLIMDENSWVEF